MAVNVGTAEGHLDLDITGFLNGLKTAQSEAQNTLQTIEQKAGSQLQGFGKTLSGIGDKMTLGITTPLVGVATAGLKVATDFEKAMSNVQAISGATGSEFEALRDEAIQLGADTAFSSGEVADAMTEMAKAGWDTQQILDGMSGVLDAAAASGESLGTVSTIVADAITGFGLEAADSTRVADLLTQSANAGTIGINDLGESFKYIAPVANTMNFSIEDVTTAITALSTAGIKGGQAGTSLRGVLTRMVKPTDDVAAAMDELNICLTNSDGTFKSLDTILAEMRTSFSGMTDEQKAYYAAVLAGTEGQSGLLTLLNMTQEEYDEIAASMDNAGGVAQETAEIMQDNLQSKVEQLGGSLESLAIRIADLVIPKLTEIVEKVTEVVNWFTELDSGTQETILKFLAFVAAIGPVLSIFGRLVTGIGGFVNFVGGIPDGISGAQTAITNFVNGIKNIPEAFVLAKAGFTGFASQTSVIGTALAGITAPIAAIIALVVSLGAAFATLWTTNEEFRNGMINTWNELVGAWNEFCQGIVDRINELGFNFESITDMISQIWNGFCELLAPVFQAAWDTIVGVLEGVMDTITGILDVIIGIFTGDTEQIIAGLQGIVEGIGGVIQSIIEGIISAISGFIDTALGFVGTNLQTVVQNIITFFQQLPTNIANFLSQVITNIQTWAGQMLTNAQQAGSNFLDGVVRFIQQLPYNIGYLLGYVITTVVSWVAQFVQNAIQAGQQFLQGVIQFVQQLPGNVANFLANVISTVASWAAQFIQNAVQAGSQFLSNVVSFISQLPGNIASFLSNVISNVAAWAANMVNAAVSMASQFVSSVVSGLASLPGQVVSIGSQVVQGIWSGISGAAGWLYDQVAGFVGGIVDGAKAALGIASPSKVMRKEVGQYIPAGIAEGIEDGEYDLNLTAYKMVDDMIVGLQTIVNQSAQGIGSAMDSGIEKGIEKEKQKPYRATESLIDEMYARALKVQVGRAELLGSSIDAAMTKQIKETQEHIEELQKTEEQRQAERDAEQHQREIERLRQEHDELFEEEEKALAKLDVTDKDYTQKRIETQEKYAEKRQDVLDEIAEKEEKWEEERTEEAKQAEIELWQGKLEAMQEYKEQYTNALQEILDKQNELTDKMKEYGELFEMVKGEDGEEIFELGDLQGQIDDLMAYGDALESLKRRGISDSLMSEILSMDIEDASRYMDALLQMSDAEYEQYMALWEQKQKLAEDIAKRFYANEILLLQNNFLNQIPEEFAGLKDEIRAQGQETIKGYLEGMLSGAEGVQPVVNQIMGNILKAFGVTVSEDDTTSEAGEQVGEKIPEGIANGFESKVPELADKIAELMGDGLLNLGKEAGSLGEEAGASLISDESLDALFEKLAEYSEGIQEGGVQFFEMISQAIEEWVVGLFEKIDEYLYMLEEKWYNFLEKISNYSIEWWQSKMYPFWVQWFTQFMILNQTKMTEMYNIWVNGLSQLYNAMIPIGQGIADGVMAGFNAAWPSVVSRVMAAVRALAAAARAALQIGSPSKVFRNEIGRWLPPGISAGFEDAMPQAIKDMQKSIDDGVNKLDVSGFTFADNGVLESVDAFNTKLSYMKDITSEIKDIGLRDVFNSDMAADLEAVRDTKDSGFQSEDDDKSSGDTFIFYSPNPINEATAAKQMRRTKRDMAYGFDL